MEKLKVEGVSDASVLHEVSGEEGDQEPKVNRDEEWSPGDSGPVPRLWHQGLPYRQGVTRPINQPRP